MGLTVPAMSGEFCISPMAKRCLKANGNPSSAEPQHPVAAPTVPEPAQGSGVQSLRERVAALETALAAKEEEETLQSRILELEARLAFREAHEARILELECKLERPTAVSKPAAAVSKPAEPVISRSSPARLPPKKSDTSKSDGLDPEVETKLKEYEQQVSLVQAKLTEFTDSTVEHLHARGKLKKEISDIQDSKKRYLVEYFESKAASGTLAGTGWAEDVSIEEVFARKKQERADRRTAADVKAVQAKAAYLKLQAEQAPQEPVVKNPKKIQKLRELDAQHDAALKDSRSANPKGLKPPPVDVTDMDSDDYDSESEKYAADDALERVRLSRKAF